MLLNLCLAALILAQSIPAEPAASAVPTHARAQEGPPPAETAQEQDSDAPLEINEAVVVTASRVEQKVRDLPASVTILTEADIERSSAQSLDELFGSVVGFSSLRTSGSRGVHPALRAASLRLGGSSRTARTLILVDGLPLNEPTGGSVYWSRVPVESIERVEIVKSGASGAWGNLAMGGVINIITAAPPQERVRGSLIASAGTQDSHHVHASLGGGRGPLSGRMSASYDATAGYVDVARRQAGPADLRNSHIGRTLDGRIHYRPTANALWTAGGSLYSEDQGGRSFFSGSRIRLGQIQGGADLMTQGDGAWRVLAMLQTLQFENRLGSPTPDRTTATPTTDQFDVPATSAAASVQWSRPIGSRQLLAAGADLQWIDTELHERFTFTAGRFTRERDVAGRQQIAGGHVRHLFHINGRWSAVAAARLDRWQALDGARREVDTVTGAVLRDDQYDDHTFWSVSPNAGIIHHPRPWLSWRATAYRGFRAPVPNELYRPVRFRTTIQEANPFLRPERVTGTEASIDVAARRSTRLRVVGFYNHLDDPILLVTIGATGADARNIPPCGFVPANGVCRENRNLGRIRNTGLETELFFTGRHGWSASMAHTLTRTRVTAAPEEPQLVGRVPRQSPSQQAVLRVAYNGARTASVAFQGRYLASRFADDLNEIRLAPAFVADMRVSRRIMGQAELFLRVQNLFDHGYETERAADGIVSVGAPRHVGVGTRWSF